VIGLVAISVSRIARAAAILGLAGATFGFTAGTVIPASRAGDGTGTISGYSATKIQYNLDASNPQQIDTVTVTLNVPPAAGSTMKAQLAGGGGWYSCSSAGLIVTCPTTSPQATVAGASLLTVIIAD
jgi:hypothetical protein